MQSQARTLLGQTRCSLYSAVYLTLVKNPTSKSEATLFVTLSCVWFVEASAKVSCRMFTKTTKSTRQRENVDHSAWTSAELRLHGVRINNSTCYVTVATILNSSLQCSCRRRRLSRGTPRTWSEQVEVHLLRHRRAVWRTCSTLSLLGRGHGALQLLDFPEELAQCVEVSWTSAFLLPRALTDVLFLVSILQELFVMHLLFFH